MKKSDGLRPISPLKILNARIRTARRRLQEEVKFCDAVWQGVGHSPVGLYQLLVSERWLPLHTPGVAAQWHRTGG